MSDFAFQIERLLRRLASKTMREVVEDASETYIQETLKEQAKKLAESIEFRDLVILNLKKFIKDEIYDKYQDSIYDHISNELEKLIKIKVQEALQDESVAEQIGSMINEEITRRINEEEFKDEIEILVHTNI